MATRPERTWEDCGTGAAYSRHVRQGTPRCQACIDYFREYMRERRQARSSGRPFSFPIEITARMDGIDLMGAAIARALRESA